MILAMPMPFRVPKKISYVRIGLCFLFALGSVISLYCMSQSSAVASLCAWLAFAGAISALFASVRLGGK